MNGVLHQNLYNHRFGEMHMETHPIMLSHLGRLKEAPIFESCRIYLQVCMPTLSQRIVPL